MLLIPGIIQPEFRITLPHGYTLLDKETSLDVKYVSADGDCFVCRRLEYDEPNVSYEEGKERFTYYLVTIHLLFETVVLFCFSQR